MPQKEGPRASPRIHLTNPKVGGSGKGGSPEVVGDGLSPTSVGGGEKNLQPGAQTISARDGRRTARGSNSEQAELAKGLKAVKDLETAAKKAATPPAPGKASYAAAAAAPDAEY